IIVEQKTIPSAFLNRYVIVDFYVPLDIVEVNNFSLLLINDGQDLDEMNFSEMLNQFLKANEIDPLLSVGIHAGKDRKNEYGTAKVLDYQGLGTKAKTYQQFILEELLPFIYTQYGVEHFKQKSFAGFSLGGLSAID